jgi:hypothetical protein
LISAACVHSEKDQPFGPAESIQWHEDANAFEVTYITSDEGYAVVFIVPDGTNLSHLMKEINQHDR